jgi:hypothetical protein
MNIFVYWNRSASTRKWELVALPAHMNVYLLAETRLSTLTWLRRMTSAGMLRRVALVRTDVSKKRSSSINIVFLRGVRRLLVTANVVLSSQILVTMMTEALHSSETSALTRTTRRNIPEYGILQSHRRENLKCYIPSACKIHFVNYKPRSILLHTNNYKSYDIHVTIMPTNSFMISHS